MLDKNSDESQNILVFSMIVFLILLSIVIWISFCAALKKMALLIIEIKQQRRRQAIISAAISQAANTPPNPISILARTQQTIINEAMQEQQDALPTYEQAMAMTTYPGLSSPAGHPATPDMCPSIA